ncbi:MAG: hypothetical protein AB7H93_07405 [Vicinamibacterales bacterium]
MPTIVACLVCGPPLDALLTGGLHAGVGVMAAVACVVLAVIGRGVARLLREDRAILERSAGEGPGR